MGKEKLTYLSFFMKQKKLAFGDHLKKLKKLADFYHIFQFFDLKGMNELNGGQCALARQNSGGARVWSEEALFCLDFSLVRFFSSKEKK